MPSDQAVELVARRARRALAHYLLAACLLAALAACDPAAAPVGGPEAKFVGTWQHDAEAASGKARLVLAVGADRKFVEYMRFTAPDGNVESHEYAGEWSYDGSNFKRRYLSDNGRKFSGGSIRYATLEVASVEPKEFVGKDHVRHREIAYHRVPDGTKP